MEITTDNIDALRAKYLSYADLIRVLRTLVERTQSEGRNDYVVQSLLQAVVCDGIDSDADIIREELRKEVRHCTPKELAVMRSALLAMRTSKL